MVIRRRLFVMMSVMAVVTLLMLLLFWLLLQRNISEIMEARNADTHSTFKRIIELEGKVMEGLAYDYTYWTEMVEFVDSKDQTWAEANLDTALDAFRCDACWVFKEDYSRVDFRRAEDVELESAALSVESCKEAFASEKFPHWFAWIDNRVFEFSGGVIQPSSDTERTTPARGYFVVAREWDDDHLANLQDLFAAAEVAILKPGPVAGNEVTKDAMCCTSHLYELNGVSGAPVATVKASLHSDQIDNLIQMNSFAAVATSIMLLLMVAFFIIGLTVWVSVPISTVSDALEKQDPKMVESLAGNKNEIGRLAQLVQAFFRQQQELKQEVNYRKEIQGKQEKLNSILQIWGRCNFAVATCDSEDQLLATVCRTIVDTGGYRTAWIGNVAWTGSKAKIHDVTKYGEDDGYVDEIRKILGNDAMRAPCVVGQSLRSKSPAVCRGVMEGSANCDEWEKEASRRGIRSVACFPLMHQGEVFAVLGVLSNEPADLDAEERRVITEVVENLAAGVLLNRSEDALGHAEKKATDLSEQLLRTQKLEAVGRLAGGIAHDFNNLLFVIMGNLELILGDGQNRANRTELTEAMEACRQASDLTKQLLSLGHRRVSVAEPVSVNDEVKRALDVMKSALKEDVEVELNLDSNIGMLLGDPVQIRQIFMNLAVNAGEAMPAGGTFSVSTESVCVEEGFAAEATAGDYVLVTVSDTGKGMDDEVLEHAFEPFFTTKDEGTGLGLSLVNSIITQHAGFIRASSQKEGGTSFRIFLPIADVLPGEKADIVKMEPFRARAAELILLVEDRDMCRLLTKTMLESLGYRVIEADSADMAIEKVETCGRKIEVVLTDVVMPGMSGPEMVLKLREKNVGAKVIYMSGYADGVLAEYGLVGTRIGVLQKPFMLAQLAQSVREALKG